MIKDEVTAMEDEKQVIQEEPYVPRPLWQVWGARIALVFVLGAVALYYWSIVHPF